jgi:hypothetical protein
MGIPSLFSDALFLVLVVVARHVDIGIPGKYDLGPAGCEISAATR